MATHRTRSIRIVLSSLCAAVVAVGLMPSIGEAQPKLTLAQVQAQMAALNAQAEVSQEALNNAQLSVAAAQKVLTQINARVAKSQAAVSSAQASVGELASAAYRSGGLDQTLQLLLADNPTQFLDQASVLSGVSRRRNDVLRRMAGARNRLAQDKLAAAQELGQIQQLRDVAAKAYRDVQAKARAATALFNTLSAADQARIKASEAARAAASREAARRAAAAHRTSRHSTRHYGGGSGIGAGVVAFAMNQLGDSYVFGASGPSSWDCSGLTMKAYASVGISLPHSSRAQFSSGRHIPISQLEPGDLVFFYSPIHHVGIYIGGGMIVHAANPSDGVLTASLYSMPFSGAVRPY